ncbi:hypothetical protein SOVF_209650, partial [Spinacia oleracea]
LRFLSPLSSSSLLHHRRSISPTAVDLYPLPDQTTSVMICRSSLLHSSVCSGLLVLLMMAVVA